MSEEAEEVGFNSEIYFVFPSNKPEFNVYDIRTEIVEGNFFTEEQIDNGEQVVILSRDVKKKYFSKKHIGDKVLVYGSYYKIIGLVDSSLSEKSCFVPFTSLKTKKMVSKVRLDISSITVMFHKPLTKDQKHSLEKDLRAYDEKGKKIKSDINMSEFFYFMTGVEYVFIISAVVLICILNMIGSFRYLTRRNRYTYVIYKLCGIKNTFFVALVYTQATALVTISFLFALLCYKMIIPQIIKYQVAISLPSGVVFMCYLVTFVIIALCLIPTVKKVANKSPIDRDLWR